MIDIDLNDQEDATPTPIGPILFERIVSASTPINSYIVMPYLWVPEIPFDKGLNDTKFLDRYSRIYIEYWVNDQEKIKKLSWYYEMFPEKYIETLIRSYRTS